MNGVLLSGIEGSTVNVTDGGAAKAALAAMTGASDAAIKGMVSANANNNDLSKYVVGQNTSLAELLGTKALVNA
ncbi:hypothetical protein EA004_30010, partial [Vibrio anguillarum]|nr:hypothetical protein [Vibrio anguillarum]